jgi:hypothetical protein
VAPEQPQLACDGGGAGDTHTFNKLIRRRYALPPSALRRM